ncbi:type II toxin-antitoxin system VapC family toxin [Leptolyngbyaceae cyanobacterium UHCC 1019]
MYTIDASVWVNSFDQREPGHNISRELLTLMATQALPIVLPTLVLAEVAGAIGRTRGNPTQAQTFAIALSNLPTVTLVSLDHALAQQTLRLAADYGLRGADAVYAAVAAQTNCTLITLDNEQLTRLTAVVHTQTPGNALITLSQSL